MKCLSRSALLLSVCLLFSTGCSSVYNSNSTKIKKGSKIFVLPLVNNTETPLAGYRASSIAESVLRVMGFQIKSAETSTKKDNLDQQELTSFSSQGKTWGANYILTGTVNEWRYKTGIDGEPAVSITFELMETEQNQVIWTGVGSKSGWGIESTGTVAQDLMNDLFDNISSE
ncbi:MAG: hypothetical protein HY606_06680 [Planctomycetes bacterium]|nr:hypothetical protein [Planctomycetota bacterium]